MDCSQNWQTYNQYMGKCGSNGGSEMKYGFQDDSILTYTFEGGSF